MLELKISISIDIHSIAQILLIIAKYMRFYV